MSDELTQALSSISARLDRIENNLAEVRSLVGPFGTVFPDGSLLVQTIHGNKYFIDPTDEIMAPQMVVYRQWEADLSSYVVNSASSDCVFVDVGANFGYFTCLAGGRIGSAGTGQVIAFEPNPKMFKLLQRNVAINWSMAPTSLHRSAVSDESGFVEFLVPEAHAANARLATADAPSIGNVSLEQFIVKSCTLDSVIENLDVDILKIDVEGFEARVFRGGGKMIRRSSAINIVMEWSLEQMKAAGFCAQDLVDIFASLGLAAHKIPTSRFAADDEWRDRQLTPTQLNTLAYDNIVLRRMQ